MEVERIRAMVRPFLAVAFGVAFILAAFISDSATENLREFTAAIIAGYFITRAVEKKG